MTYKMDFIKLCLQYEAIRFGEFTLKSGRVSPYFLNAGMFQTGVALAELGKFYANAIHASRLEYDVIFGPAYKGIPLVSSCAVALSNQFDIDKPYCFNRKEAKDHGEGGQLVGAPLSGRVLIVDDVITAGTAIRESLQLISKNDASLAGVVVLFDRRERGQGERSAIQEIEVESEVPVITIASVFDLLEYIRDIPEHSENTMAIENYLKEYGIS